MLPVPVLKPDIVPAPFRGWLCDCSHRMQTPLDYAFMTAIAMAGSVIGTGCRVQPLSKNYKWLETPNLWGLIIAPPGMRKSPVLSEVFSPLGRLEAVSSQQFDQETKKYKVAAKGHQLEIKALEFLLEKKRKGIKTDQDRDFQKELEQLIESAPQEPRQREYRVNDTTIEALLNSLTYNTRGILLYRDELSGMMAQWEMPGHDADRGILLEAWNGYNPYTGLRMGRGRWHVPLLCASIYGGIQPAKLVQYLRQIENSISGDGLIYRFQLLCYPDVPDQRDVPNVEPDKESRNRVFEIIEKLANMDFPKFGATVINERYGKPITVFTFDDQAQEFFIRWLKPFQNRTLKDPNPHMQCHLAKYNKLVPSLALIFHLIHVADHSIPRPIELRHLQNAIALADYLEAHARRVFALTSSDNLAPAIVVRDKIRLGELQDGFTLYDLMRKHWASVNDRNLAGTALARLTEAHYIREQPKPTTDNGGKPTIVYRINPAAFNGSGET